MRAERTYMALGMGGLRSENPDLDTYAASWMTGQNGRFVVSRACSPIDSETRDGSYPMWDLANLLSQRAAPISNEDPAPRGQLKLERKNFLIDPVSFETAVDDLNLAQAGGALEIEREATELSTRATAAVMEQRYFDAVHKSGVWNANVAGAQAPTAEGDFDPYSADAADRNIRKLGDENADVVDDVQRLKTAMEERTGFEPNKLIVSPHVFRALANHDSVVDRLNRGQTQGAVRANAIDLSYLFEIGEERAVADGMEGVIPARSLKRVGKFFASDPAEHAWLGYVDANPGRRSVTAVACVSWNRFAPGAQIVIDSYYDRQRRAMFMRATAAFDIHLSALDLGCYISGWL